MHGGPLKLLTDARRACTTALNRRRSRSAYLLDLTTVSQELTDLFAWPPRFQGHYHSALGHSLSQFTAKHGSEFSGLPSGPYPLHSLRAPCLTYVGRDGYIESVQQHPQTTSA